MSQGTITKRRTVADYPHLVTEWDWEKNGDLRPEAVPYRSHRKVWWKCRECQYCWPAAASKRTSGRGCPCCAGKVVTYANCLQTVCPEVAIEWHPLKNGNLTPKVVKAGSGKKVWWQCSQCGYEWCAAVYDRSNGRGCASCTGQVASPFNCLSSLFPQVASEWNSRRNAGLTPNDVTAGSGKKAWWICSKCSYEWRTVVKSRSQGSGCPNCAGQVVNDTNCLMINFPEIGSEWHPTRNGSLTAYDVAAGTQRSVWWRCKRCDHEYASSINNRTSQGSGCPKCRTSKGEKIIGDYIERYSIPRKPQWGQGKGGLEKRYAFDFAVNRNNEFWLIEYHGEQHYIPVSFGSKKQFGGHWSLLKCLKRDRIKERWCREKNKKLLVIPFWEFKRIEEILTEFFAGRTPVMSEPPEKVKAKGPLRQRIVQHLQSLEI